MSASQFILLFAGGPTAIQLTPEDLLPPNFRKTDPKSSERAVKDAAPTIRGQRAIAFRLVRENPGRTAAELAAIHAQNETERFKTMIWLRKRLPELRELKLAHTTHDGSADQVWWPND